MVNMENHWSLCAVYNAAQIANVDKKDDFHSQSQVSQNVRDWLNAVWYNKCKKCEHTCISHVLVVFVEGILQGLFDK
jgi:hypothetical protein